jgi:D-alanyl-D-alanine carboxypeptidase
VRATFIAAVLVAVLVGGPLAAPALGAPGLVIDAATGEVLVSEEATRPWHPASTTKMMTAFVALRAVKAGRLTIDTPLVASANAARQKPSKVGIRPGQEITLDNALKIMMVRSANDLAVVIAEAVGGSVPGFAQMMNAEARRLGMNETRFSNPHGFHEVGHQTSARDLALLARAMLVEYPEFNEYWGISSVQLGNRVMNNTNGLIGRYPGASGLKTGFVCASGFNLVATANRGGRTLISVVLGASSGGERVLRSAQLLDQAFGSWGNGGQTLNSLPASGYSSAPDMRQEICTNRRRGVVLSDDSDYSGTILADTQSGDSMAGGSPMAFFSMQSQQAAPRNYAARPSGRGLLGPRVAAAPIPVFMGRAPGSTAVAVGPGTLGPGSLSANARRSEVASALPASTTALTATSRGAIPGLERPAAQAAIRAGARPRPLDDEAATDTPLQLNGVISGGARPNSPRPAAAAAIRSRTAAVNPAQQPAKAAPVSEAKRKQDAVAKAKADKAKADKAKADKTMAQKAKAKAQKASAAKEPPQNRPPLRTSEPRPRE